LVLAQGAVVHVGELLDLGLEDLGVAIVVAADLLGGSCTLPSANRLMTSANGPVAFTFTSRSGARGSSGLRSAGRASRGSLLRGSRGASVFLPPTPAWARRSARPAR
jgi:hypothetical protein